MRPFENVLFLIESEISETGPVEKAVERAQSLGASLTLASVVPSKRKSRLVPIGKISADKLEQLSIEAETERLEQLAARYRERGLQILTRVLAGDPAPEIARVVSTDGYEMVWKAAAGATNLKGRFLGCPDMRLIRACPCPVAIVDSQERLEQQTTFVAAVDVAPPAGGDEVTEELNQAILQLALSGLTGAEHQLHIVHAWTVYGESILASPRVRFKREELDALVEAEHAMRRTNVEGLLERFRSGLSSAHADRFNPEVHLIKGDPKSAISEAVQRLDADILVMGSKCRSGPSGLILGNTAEEILHRLECSVAVVKPGDFVSPVSVA